MVEDINLNVGVGSELGDSIIQNVKGVSIVIRRSLRDLFHQIPSTEITIKIEELKASLSNKEYEIITECTLSNFSEPQNTIPPLSHIQASSSTDVVEPLGSQTLSKPTTSIRDAWIDMKVSVYINLVELELHLGATRDASLALLQIKHAWLLYKSTTMGDGFLSATLKSFTVIDNREGTEEEFRLAVGNSDSFGCSQQKAAVDASILKDKDSDSVPTMIILDAKFTESLMSITLCVQRPQLLVALDFLLSVVEFFVPTVADMLSNQENGNSSQMIDAFILDQSTYIQQSSKVFLSPKKPLVADDERFDFFIYDGGGGTLHLQDRNGRDISAPSKEIMIYIGDGKRVQFKNVIIKGGRYLDSCISLGTNSGYSASADDKVILEGSEESPQQSSEESLKTPSQSAAAVTSTDLIIELQAIGPELTFYNTSKDIAESLILSNKLLHAQFDAFCRVVLKGDTMEASANAIGFAIESNGIRILEPFDTKITFTTLLGKPI
ncbi:unnamed protein product [Rhodiola kirilowii]